MVIALVLGLLAFIVVAYLAGRGEGPALLTSEVTRLSTEFGEWADSIRIAAAEPGGWLDGRLARRVVVHTTDDQSIEGLLDTVAPDGVVLRAARLLLADKVVPLAGEVWVPRNRVRFAQTVPVTEVSP